MKKLILFLVCFGLSVFAERTSHSVNTDHASAPKLSDNAAKNLEGIFLLADKIEVIHTTRELAPAMEGSFPAGRYGVTLSTSGEAKRFLVIETESKVGHFKPITPGDTKVDGYVRMVKDRDSLYSGGEVGEQLQTHQLGKLCVRLLKFWGDPTTIKDANHKLTLQALIAIYTNGVPGALEKLYKEAGVPFPKK